MRINNTDRASKAGLSGTRQADSVTVQLGERKLADVRDQTGRELMKINDPSKSALGFSTLKAAEKILTQSSRVKQSSLESPDGSMLIWKR